MPPPGSAPVGSRAQIENREVIFRPGVVEVIGVVNESYKMI